jgi:deazaflavin-dependent oxidoreductase (nitroreductase family)
MPARAPLPRGLKFGNAMIGFLNKLGLRIGPMYLLRVKGRTSGKEYTNPVSPVTVEGTQYILQAFPESDWVKNVRAANEGTLVRGRKAQRVRMLEVPADERAPIAAALPTQMPKAVKVYVDNGVVADGSPAGFARAAPGIPIFRVEPIG